MTDHRSSVRWDLLLPLAAVVAGGIMIALAWISNIAFIQRDALALDGRVLGIAQSVELRLRESGLDAAEEIVEDVLENGGPDVLGAELVDSDGRTLVSLGREDKSLNRQSVELFVGPGFKGSQGWQGRDESTAGGGHRGGLRGKGRVTLVLRLGPEAGKPPVAVRLLPAVTIAVAIALITLSFLGGRLLVRQRRAADRRADERRLEALARAGAGLAHQLRTPLATVKGSCQLIEEQIRDAPHRKRLEAAIKQTDRMEKMLGMLLDFATPPAPQPQTVEIRRHLEEMADQSESLDLGRVDDVTVEVDPEHLSQILDNLLDNARAVSPPDGTVSVSAATDRDRIEIVVADRGPGPGEDPETLFEPYLTTRTDGTGLGLTIARTLAEANRGSLTLRSRVGGGCEAVLSLDRNRKS